MRPVLPRQCDVGYRHERLNGPVNRLGRGYPATHSENRAINDNSLITGMTCQQTLERKAFRLRGNLTPQRVHLLVVRVKTRRAPRHPPATLQFGGSRSHPYGARFDPFDLADRRAVSTQRASLLLSAFGRHHVRCAVLEPGLKDRLQFPRSCQRDPERSPCECPTGGPSGR